jgi:hypothetical protein
VVVLVDVGGDHLPGLVEGFELVAPDAAFHEVAGPALDECLALGVALAAAAVSDSSPDSTSLVVERAAVDLAAPHPTIRLGFRRWKAYSDHCRPNDSWALARPRLVPGVNAHGMIAGGFERCSSDAEAVIAQCRVQLTRLGSRRRHEPCLRFA